MVMETDCLENLLKGSGSALIITHRHADIDAIASAELLKTFLEKRGLARVDIYVPEGISGITASLLESLGLWMDRVYNRAPQRL